MTYKTKGFLLYLFGFVFICFLRDKVNHMTIILLCIGYLLFICLFYTVNKSAAIKPLYNFLQRVLKENNKKRITNEDIVKSMKRYAPIGSIFFRDFRTEGVVLGYNTVGILYMDKDTYIESCKTLFFHYDDIYCRFYDDFLEYNKQPLEEKIEDFDEVTYLKYKLFSKDLSQVPTEVKEICLNQKVIGKTKLTLFLLYKLWILNVMMILATLLLLAIFGV